MERKEGIGGVHKRCRNWKLSFCIPPSPRLEELEYLFSNSFSDGGHFHPTSTSKMLKVESGRSFKHRPKSGDEEIYVSI
jgi:hypothetical protein